METISGKDFFEKLNEGTLTSSFHLFGKVKKSDKASEVLFSFKSDHSYWLPIPETMISSVHILKSYTCSGENISLVKIHLKEPTDKEAKILYALLSSLSYKMCKLWDMKMMGSHSHCMHHEEERHHCDHGFDFHKESGCGCHKYKHLHERGSC